MPWTRGPFSPPRIASCWDTLAKEQPREQTRMLNPRTGTRDLARILEVAESVGYYYAADDDTFCRILLDRLRKVQPKQSTQPDSFVNRFSRMSIGR